MFLKVKLAHRDILGQREFQGIDAEKRSKGKRTTFERQAGKDCLMGGAAMVSTENVVSDLRSISRQPCIDA
jgi:hypothetical protein